MRLKYYFPSGFAPWSWPKLDGFCAPMLINFAEFAGSLWIPLVDPAFQESIDGIWEGPLYANPSSIE